MKNIAARSPETDGIKGITSLALRYNPSKALLFLLLFFSTTFLLLSCDDIGNDGNNSNAVSEEVIKAYPEPLQEFMRATLNKSAKTLSIVYVSKDGGSETPKNGSTRAKAYAEAELKTAIDAAGDAASAAEPYLVLLDPDTYAITSTLSMKNDVLIAGGIAEDGRRSTTPTILDGGENTQIFSNSSLDKSAALYGVTINKGKTTGNGGGMLNRDSSPSLMQITFSGNTADFFGGGMYNDNSSPILTQLIFSDNKAGKPVIGQGGGMYNRDSAPILTQVIFSGNMAVSQGGGMYNTNSSPILTQVTFSGNTVLTFGASPPFARGGGMANFNQSSPILTQVSFFGNTARLAGGAIYNDNDGTGPKIVNSIFWGNTAGADNAKSQIYTYNNTDRRTESLSIHNSVLEGGIAGLTYYEPPVGNAAAANTYVVSSDIITDDPNLINSNITLYPGAAMVMIPKIQTGSSAINEGLYIQRSGTTFYYSKNASDWYTVLNSAGLSKAAPTLILVNHGTGFSTTSVAPPSRPPAGAINLTATDITGAGRSGRPDIGAFEFG